MVKTRPHKNDAKKEFVLGLMEAKKKVTAKVINFSFGFSFTPHKKSLDKSNMNATKMNFFDPTHVGR